MISICGLLSRQEKGVVDRVGLEAIHTFLLKSRDFALC
ncbi:MAG: hypothetical protein M2R45_04210 [Verrucomicrobia subdivision 3 bacterium]|nr:hypothetical protein [Limisphaerales bacterium]MCS1417053.1 hypothetical protein [Limisphaerales bacterium]